MVAVGENLANTANDKLFKPGDKIKKAGLEFLFNGVGCTLGVLVAVNTAGAGVPLAVAGCARAVASLVKLGSAVLDTYATKKWLSPGLKDYITVQNQ